MARKSCYVKNLMYRDKLALVSVSRCGYVTEEQLNNYIKNNRISNYCKEKLIVKETIVTNKNVSVTAYKLTPKGKDALEKNFGIKNHYASQSIKHDLQIANKYFSLTEKEKESWKTETLIRKEFLEKLESIKSQEPCRYEELLEQLKEGKVSMPDCSYTTETGIEVFFESVTNNYSKEELEAKERAIEFLKGENTYYETSR